MLRRLWQAAQAAHNGKRLGRESMLRFARALRPRRARGLVIAAVALTSLVSANTALAQVPQSDCDERVNNTYKKVLECVRVSEVREHQAALQAIADANGGTREAGTSGYTASVDYVVDTLEAAGWSVSLDEFPFTFIPPSTLRQLTPVAATMRRGPTRAAEPAWCRGRSFRSTSIWCRRGPARAAARQRFRRDRLERPEQHRADPARHLLLRHQGDQCAGCRGRGGNHLQPGRHPLA